MRHWARLEPAVALLAIALAMFHRLDAVPFYVDESCKIGYSAPFEAFASGRFSDPVWRTREDRYLNPVLTYYVVGAARRMGGYGADRLNEPWDFSVTDEENARRGRTPEPGLLWWSRAGVTAAACAGIFVLFLMMTRAGQRWTALVWLGLTLTNPFLRTALRRALNEGVLLATIALTMWALCRALQRFEDGQGPGVRWPAMGWIAAAGFGAGLSAQTKLNGGMAAAAVWLVLALAAARWRVPLRARARHLLLATIIVAVCSAGAFVGSNPSLWPHPPRETVRMVRARVEVMNAQALEYRHQAIGGIPQRLLHVPRRVMAELAALPNGPLNLLLFALGTGASALILVRWLRARDDNHARVVLTVAGAMVSAPALVAPIDWSRYYVLPVVFSSMQIVFGIEWLALRARRVLSAARAGR
jgi:4-amino-4-deoxy-L-arabinose transferase-like glycosyltransferase